METRVNRSSFAADPEMGPGSEEKGAEYWRAEYEHCCEQLEQTDFRQTETRKQDRRANPRLTFPPGAKVFVHHGATAYPIINISVGGIAFYSISSFTPGENLVLSAKGIFALEVEVIECTMKERDPIFMDFHYLVRGKFGKNVNGFQAFVMAREIYLRMQEGRDSKMASL